MDEKYLSLINNLDAFYEIINLYTEVENNINEIVTLIKNLPSGDNVNIDDEEKVIEIREKYELLDDKNKVFVTNYNKLLDTEQKIEKLKQLDEDVVDIILNCINDVHDTNANDEVITSVGKYQLEWISLKPTVLYYEDGYFKVSKINQTHTNQTITILVKLFENDIEVVTISKEVVVKPILFEELSNTPVATYFQSGALSTYQNYSKRYQEERTLFSDKAKEVLDIIYYAFANIDSYGNVSVSNSSLVNELMQMRQYDVRIIMCISGVSTTSSTYFAQLTKDDKTCVQFVKNIMDIVEKYNFDGVDIDWESTSGAKVIAERMNRLSKLLRQEMTARQADGGSEYLLTAAIPSSSWGAGEDRFDFATLNKYLDYVNMMSYDLHQSGKTTHLSPLYSSSNDNGYGFSCDYGVKLFTSRGLDSSKIIIGAAGYGKAYKISGSSSSDTYPGLGVSASLTKLSGVAGSYSSGTLFGNGIDIIYEAGTYKKYLEYNKAGKLVGSYLYNEKENIFVTYDSSEVISEKYKYAKDYKGMGIMCWAYTEDTSDNYINSIYDILE